MELSLRLQYIAAMVDKCEIVADIGTDHAYLPIYLVKKSICNKAVASDINLGPVEKAKLNVTIEDVEDKIDCRLGGGLTVLKPKEVQGAVIAGMGGNLIRDIIEERLNIFMSLEYAVVQPVQNPEILRKYIYSKGYKIIDEELCFDEGKYYEILKIKYDNKPTVIEDIYYEVSKVLLDKKHPLLSQYINFKIDRYYQIYSSINKTTDSAVMRKKEVQEKILKLKELLNLCL